MARAVPGERPLAATPAGPASGPGRPPLAGSFDLATGAAALVLFLLAVVAVGGIVMLSRAEPRRADREVTRATEEGSDAGPGPRAETNQDYHRPDPPAAAPPPRPQEFKRLDVSDEEALLRQLLLVREIRGQRRDEADLPVRAGLDCQLGKEAAENLQVLSRKLRTHLEACIPRASGDLRPDPDELRRHLLDAGRREWVTPEAVPALLQLLQAENRPVRRVLVECLGQIRDRRATAALAMRAMADLSAEVRQAAVQGLRDRPREDYEPLLLAGFSHPWPPVADHAAEALVALEDRDAVPSLVKVLEAPDPNLCFPMARGEAGRKTVCVQELVRINHLANCVLCHESSHDRNDLVRGAVPTPGRPLPAPATTPQYYERDAGAFVHADITYLRQDFSVMQPVRNPDPWPAYQRYDYLVVRRPATEEERELAAQRATRSCPQRDAALFALRALTGKDCGTTAVAWRRALPEDRATWSLSDPVIRAVTRDWQQFLPPGDLRHPFDPETAVREAVEVAREERKNARERAERFARLRQGLQDASVRSRRESARGLGELGPEAAPAVPDLAGALHDRDPEVREAAAVALGRIGPPGRAASRDLFRARSEGPPKVREAAARTLEQLGTPEGGYVPALVEVLKSADATRRAEAAETLGWIGGEAGKAAAALKAALRDGSAEVRVQAALALWRVEPQADVVTPVFVAALRGEGVKVRREALTGLALVGLKSTETVPALTGALQDADDLVCVRAAEALCRMTPVRPTSDAILALRKALTGGTAEARLEASHVLDRTKMTGRNGGYAALEATLVDPDDEVRTALLEAMAEWDEEALKPHVPALLSRLRDPNTAVQKAAAGVLRKLIPTQSANPSAGPGD
jgi:HEAT repeat protein